MKRICLVLLSVLVCFCVTPSFGQSSADDIAESSREFAEWTKSLAAFVKDVRFNDEDVQSLIDLYHDFTILGGEDDEQGEFTDFSTVLNDKEYQAFVELNGLNSEMWLKKTMRILAVMMRTEMAENSSEETFDMQAQLSELEEMRAEIGEEAYQQAKQALAAGAAAMDGMEEAYRNLPEPSDAEKVVLAKYRDQLVNLE